MRTKPTFAAFAPRAAFRKQGQADPKTCKSDMHKISECLARAD
ncbi:hypothetical protein DSW25_12425 [Sulfitobacter donghicola DSW-25 = KCTC 12864 = JCM 14565]|uniref:Uncharacterized protein n=1 Tax=Sulfitobacter donghicola DSW-25 = KCTC 12864 = JCM 14565 TaxID=1300350 RepID=A0A073IUU3_9RHOB|nr:hypothetical protein DSW25_12425 [Sulfitobacter donghicola DSW-25 = KCTC 12864 = JCM 14565]